MESELIGGLLEEIHQFRLFADSIDYRDCYAWECNYDGWGDIYRLFEAVLSGVAADRVSGHVLEQMVYIIARDNEPEHLIDVLPGYPEWFGILCRHSLHMDEPEARWQFADRLPQTEVSDGCRRCIIRFLEDEDEYVSRRALLVLPRIMPGKVEAYADLFWNRRKYSGELEQYQKLAVLTALKEAGSPQWTKYARLVGQEDEEWLRLAAAGCVPQDVRP